jgi:hypothetical protein
MIGIRSIEDEAAAPVGVGFQGGMGADWPIWRTRQHRFAAGKGVIVAYFATCDKKTPSNWGAEG